MQRKVEAWIGEHGMLDRGSRVVAGVSGGADSVCLLHLLVCLKTRLGLELQAVHVHHGLRGPEADRDAQFVRELSATWKVPCLVVYRDVAGYAKIHGMSTEEAGRKLRYEALHEAARQWGGARIAVAHHKDDQAETILHHLFRGSGLKGLCGMEPVREDIIRPLLCVTRREILDYLEKHSISFCEDSSNASMDYTRNKLRHQVIPMVCQEVNSGAVEHIVAAGERIRQAEAYFDQEAKRIWQEAGVRELQGQAGMPEEIEAPEQAGTPGKTEMSGSEKGCGRWRRCGIRAETLLGLPDILQGYTALEMIGEMDGSRKDITADHVAQILDLAGKGTGRSCSLPRGLRAYKEYHMVWVEKTGKQKEQESREEKETERQPAGPGHITCTCFSAGVLREKHQKIPEKKYTKWFDYDKIKDTLSVRTRETGDFFMLKGGKKKTVKAFMIDEKIPRPERDRILLLAEGHHVLWIVGYRISEFYKITDKTKQILQVKMDGGKEHEG